MRVIVLLILVQQPLQPAPSLPWVLFNVALRRNRLTTPLLTLWVRLLHTPYALVKVPDLDFVLFPFMCGVIDKSIHLWGVCFFREGRQLAGDWRKRRKSSVCPFQFFASRESYRAFVSSMKDLTRPNDNNKRSFWLFNWNGQKIISSWVTPTWRQCDTHCLVEISVENCMWLVEGVTSWYFTILWYKPFIRAHPRLPRGHQVVRRFFVLSLRASEVV